MTMACFTATFTSTIPLIAVTNSASHKPTRQAPSIVRTLRDTKSETDISCYASRAVQPSELNNGIKNFYDSSSGIWEDIWGEHMHHGYYESEVPLFKGSLSLHQDAQIKMIEEALAWARIPEDESGRPKSVVDIGCGIGGSARYLARKYGAKVHGITLSPRQVQRATEITAAEKFRNQVTFQVADALNQPFPDNEFDLVWSMESGEHMPDKKRFVSELARVAGRGGQILIVTWCHRELLPTETSLKQNEKELLDKICDAYYLPAWCSASRYIQLAEEFGLKEIKTADWSKFVAPFWPAVIGSAISLKGLSGLFKSGWTTIKGALAMALMVQGYRQGLIKYTLITARKP
ncbi:hypothetical protein O6H91_03G070300 [Diphasiastrum complanatum]|uniref:Uncharacterized protein n=6 Tax=Diphasiastrum complanatum TaxID=34168 RepID=A0ACC2E7Y0_DIPCM|nr:hypothetical protein O6H91_03G070300 [Diphasiastrum complanatum]KAJ7562471.1 hypothetical protein O6H91_03G070300 [Diphasiastrum complanatum]KAJ7562472.1 hypothetical protein O6H91_03G070300 [Diphasiastrum complanatum]KAJ7562473.1 hypothetical protein O6H91_03G070300 [Diphasiastrum complanatum]KAJ7562474.1 hypothetical protein O6H91_03G070300 [Diphasiastrum complanatum]